MSVALQLLVTRVACSTDRQLVPVDRLAHWVDRQSLSSGCNSELRCGWCF